MFETLKKKSFKKSLFTSVLWIVIGAALLIICGPRAFHAVTGYQNFLELKPEEIKPGQIVEVDLYATLGCYAEMYEQKEGSSYKKTTDLYYAIFTGDENDEDYRIMSVKVPAILEKDMEKLYNDYWDDGIADTVYLCGTIKKLNDKEYSYFGDVIDAYGEENTLPYYIDCYTGKTAIDIFNIIGVIGGAALLVYGIIRIVNGSKNGFLKKFLKDIADAGYTDSMIDSDYNRGISFPMTSSKDDSIKIGRLMTYYFDGAAPRALPNNKIMWAYQNTTTHRTNGIKTGTTYSVTVIVERVSTAYTISVANEAAAQNILKTMNQMFPWVITGYSEDLKKLLHSNRDQFVALRYNTCEHIAVEPDMNSTSMTEM